MAIVCSMKYIFPAHLIASLCIPFASAEDLKNSFDMTMIDIKGGEFTMGSPASEKSRGRDEDQAKAKISSDFWISSTEVTQGQWAAVTGMTLDKLIETKIGALGRGAKLKNYPSAVGDKQPMCFVNYADVLEFCEKLTKLEKDAGKLPEGYEYTLPTEAQWEYAARSGTSTTFAFGNSLDGTQACFYGPKPYNSEVKVEYKEKTENVASFKPNAWGLYDMHGNVYEWCLDWYVEKIPGGEDPVTLKDGDSRSIRGGAWNRPATSSRSSYRYSYDPTQRTNNIGFRVALVKQK